MSRIPQTAEELKTAKDMQKLKKERDLTDLRWVLSKPAGRRVIWWLLQITNFYSDEFTGNSRDYYNKGKRAIGSELHSKVVEAAGFKAFDRMYKEALHEQEIERQIQAKREEED